MATIAVGKRGSFLNKTIFIFFIFYFRNNEKGTFLPCVASEGTSLVNRGRKKGEGFVTYGAL